MQPNVITALHDWELDWQKVQTSATRALQTAFVPLDKSPTPPYCCPVTLDYAHDRLGSGRVCIDDHGRVTVEFDQLPNLVIAEAIDEVFGIAWFDGADKPLLACGPGTYNYDCESTGAEYEVVLGTDGVGKVYVACAVVPDAAAVLDALSAAASRLT